MAERYPGGVISKTPPVVDPGGVDSGANLYGWGGNAQGRLGVTGRNGVASGVWSLPEVSALRKAQQWPQLFDSSVNRSSPVSIGSFSNWDSVSTADSGGASAGMKTDGTLWTWGINSSGQLGLGFFSAFGSGVSSPTQVGTLTNWAQSSMSYGNCHALKTDGTLWGWGNNSQGSVGDNTTTYRNSPVQIGALTTWAQAGYCAAIRTNGTLWTWGANFFGQRGAGAFILSTSSPVQVGALTNWAQVSSKGVTRAAITTGGQLYAWGRNTYSAVGDNTTINRSSPVQIGALTTWAKVEAGNYISFAVKTDGTLWAWGSNGNGQLGDSTTVSRSSPVQVGALTNWSQASGGFAVASAVKTDGTLWTWGSGTGGHLGDNTVISKSSPVQIGSLTNWTQVATGSACSFAIEAD